MLRSVSNAHLLASDLLWNDFDVVPMLLLRTMACHLLWRLRNVATFASKSDGRVTTAFGKSAKLLKSLVAQLVRAAES